MANKKSARESILREKTVKAPRVHVDPDQRFKSLKVASILAVCVCIAICLVFNLLVYFLLDKPLTFDATSVKSNTVGLYTKNFLKEMDKTVEIIGLFEENDSSIQLKDYFVPIMADYEAKADGKITLRYVDPDINPFILTELDPENVYGLSKGMYVLRCGDRLTTLVMFDCFEYDTSLIEYNMLLPVENRIEAEVTGRIFYLTSGSSLKAYYLTGHNEQASHSYLDMILGSLGMMASDITLSGENAKIPEDCELLIILQPAYDISLMEKELLISYLDNGGRVMLVNDFNDNKSIDYTNLNQVAMRMGVTLEPGMLHENDINYLYTSDDPYTSIGIADEEYAQMVGIADKYMTQNNRYLKVYPDREEGVYVSPLITTSDIASVDFPGMQIGADVSSGTYGIVMLSVDSNRTEQMPWFLVFGTETFTSDEYYSVHSLSDNNAVFVRACLADMIKIQATVPVLPKKTPSYALQKPLSSTASTTWSLIVMGVIPIGTLVCGIYTYKKRRHL